MIKAEPDLEITKFGNSPGIFFEDIGVASLTNINWLILIHSDLSVLKAELQEIKLCVTAFGKICYNISRLDPHCLTTLEQLKSDLLRVEENEEIMFTSSRRERRGLLNGVGIAANYLFGTLNSNDAEYYDNQINLTKENENNLLALIKNQTSIMNATVGVIKTTHQDVIARFNVIINKIESLKNTVDKVSTVTQLSTLKITTTLVLSKFREVQSSVLRSLQNMRPTK